MWVTEKSCRLRGIFFTPPKISAPKTPSRDLNIERSQPYPLQPRFSQSSMERHKLVVDFGLKPRDIAVPLPFFFFCEISWKLVNLGFRKKTSSRWWQLKYFLFSPPKFWEDEPILTHIFQVGWFNHQLVFIPKKGVFFCGGFGGREKEAIFSFDLSLGGFWLNPPVWFWSKDNEFRRDEETTVFEWK